MLSQQWGRYSLPFKGEGLAGWVQRTKQAKPIAFEALVYLCGGAYVSLARLLDNATWYADRSFSYAMAGTFTTSPALAEDIAQETWLAVIRGIRDFEGRSSLRTWIYSILIRRARIILRISLT